MRRGVGGARGAAAATLDARRRSRDGCRDADDAARGTTLLPELDVATAYLEKILLKTYERAPEDFETLLGIEGVGPKTLRALALASELLHGTPASHARSGAVRVRARRQGRHAVSGRSSSPTTRRSRS